MFELGVMTACYLLGLLFVEGVIYIFHLRQELVRARRSIKARGKTVEDRDCTILGLKRALQQVRGMCDKALDEHRVVSATAIESECSQAIQLVDCYDGWRRQCRIKRRASS